jgi:hypothetical protein
MESSISFPECIDSSIALASLMLSMPSSISLQAQKYGP